MNMIAIGLIASLLAGTNFFNPAGGGDPIIDQHMFWFYSQTAVYIPHPSAPQMKYIRNPSQSIMKWRNETRISDRG